MMRCKGRYGEYGRQPHAMPERDKECAAVIGEIFERVKIA